MTVRTFNNDWKPTYTKEELTKLLKKYEGILNHSMIDYLKSLIELDFSVIREYIGIEERKALSELEVYKQIAIYNIYMRALNLFHQEKRKFEIRDDKYYFEKLNVSIQLSDRNVDLFYFDRRKRLSLYQTIPDEYKTMKIGNISLYQTLESKELREAELNRIMHRLEQLYDAHNPYPSPKGVIGSSGSQWAMQREQDIIMYEQKFTKLDNKKELNQEDQKEIEITNKIFQLLLEDYGLTKESFTEENSNSIFNFNSSKSNLQKTLIKKQPNLTITTHIKYI